ncbi:MAG: hypothetical protein AAF570_21185, partial [Bacteroidota bacterium]
MACGIPHFGILPDKIRRFFFQFACIAGKQALPPAFAVRLKNCAHFRKMVEHLLPSFPFWNGLYCLRLKASSAWCSCIAIQLLKNQRIIMKKRQNLRSQGFHIALTLLCWITFSACEIQDDAPLTEANQPPSHIALSDQDSVVTCWKCFSLVQDSMAPSIYHLKLGIKNPLAPGTWATNFHANFPADFMTANFGLLGTNNAFVLQASFSTEGPNSVLKVDLHPL